MVSFGMQLLCRYENILFTLEIVDYNFYCIAV